MQVAADRKAGKPVPGGSVLRKTLSSWEVNLHYNAALMEMGQGDVTLLKELREAFRKDSGTRSDDEQGFNIFYPEFLKQSALGIAMDVTRRETAGFHDAFDVFADVALDSLEPNAGNRAEKIGEVLSICHFLAYWCGEPERFDSLLAKVSASRKVALKREEGAMRFLELAKTSQIWSTPQFTSAREGVVRGMFSRPEFLAAFPTEASWTDRFEKVMEPGEFENLAVQLPADWTAALRSPLCMYNARKAKAAKRSEEALDWYRRALGESCGGEWAMFGNLIRIEYAETLSAMKRPAEARELLTVIRQVEMRPEWQKRYNQVAAAVGLKK
ncbi:MAG: hypothetical protein QM755_04535 [Luteolibacter sp.]